MGEAQPVVVIIDYGLGNLFSIQQACLQAGVRAEVSSSPRALELADGVILPGMGAFGDAMAALRQLDLVAPLRDFVDSGRQFLGICLGMQLVMSESYEFGLHRGLGYIEGPVVRFEGNRPDGRPLKVPLIGWEAVTCPPGRRTWQDTLLEGVAEGEHFYFVHSYYPKPIEASVVLSWSQYGPVGFCSAIEHQNITAFQYHPERSGSAGALVYRNLARKLTLQNSIRARSHGL